MEIHGTSDPAFEPVREAFIANFDAGLELGASVAVTVDGKPGKVKEILPLLTDRIESVRVLKRDTLAFRDGRFESITASWRSGDAGSPGESATTAPVRG